MAEGGLSIYDFAENDPLRGLTENAQILYIRDYLADLGATSVLREQAYFDQDYLAEFSAFYAASSRPYPNFCQRLHYFSGPPLTRQRLRSALGGSQRICKQLQDSYLGFVVVRPLSAAPLGRTVLRWYEDDQPQTPRIVEPGRFYEVHVAGLTLRVWGLAWQQQDSAVGACATVALWSMMHSAAFDDQHAIPTTADITRLANRTASLGARVFPSDGLRLEQVLEAVKECRLAPIVVEGREFPPSSGATLPQFGFEREQFSCMCASLIRSGYPVLLVGRLQEQGQLLGEHAVCAVGFREAHAVPQGGRTNRFQDADVQCFYLHDDNIGPNARFEVTGGQGVQPARLVRAPPPPRNAATPGLSWEVSYPDIIPHSLIVAVHEDIRVTPGELNKVGFEAADNLQRFIAPLMPHFSATLSTRFVRLPVYLGSMLEHAIGGNARALARARLALCEQVPPMSFHLGLVRLGYGARPLMDILYDTSDHRRHLRPHCHVVYQRQLAEVTRRMREREVFDFGPCVDAS